MQADVNVKLVFSLRAGVKKRVEAASGGGLNKRKVIEKAVFDELCALLDSGLPKERDGKERKQELRKGRPNVVMFVGLQVCMSACMDAAHAHAWLH